MLKVMRDSFHHLKWVLIAVVAAFIFGFVFIDMGLSGGSLTGNSGDIRNYAARVNGETITINEFQRSLGNLENMYSQMYGQQFTPQMAEAMGLQKQVLDNLVDQRLLMQEARRINLEATPEEVRKALLEIPNFVENGKFIGMEAYRNFVTSRGFADPAAFEETLARELTLQKMESALMNSVVVSPKTAEAEYRRNNENAKIRFIVVPADPLAPNVSVSPVDVEQYYKANIQKYAHGEQRQIRYLLADFAKVRAQITPSEAELQEAYNKNRDRYRTPGAAKVQHILIKVDPTAAPAADAAALAKAKGLVQQLRGGADFAALARANSEDPSSSGNGGDMGWVDQGQTVQPFEQAIFSIPLNTISDPIRSQEYGYHIVKVTERREPGVRPFAQVRPELTATLVNERSRELARTEINRINAILKQNKPKDVTAFSNLATANVTSNDSGWFGRNEQIAGIGAHQPLTQWVFSAKPGDVSEPIGTPRGIAIAYVQDVRGAGTSALADVRQQVEQDARLDKARQAARTALAQQMAGATSIDQVAAKVGQPVQEATVTRQGNVAGVTGDATALIDAAIAANVGQLSGPVGVGNGAVAFQVVEQKKVTAADFAQNRDTFLDTLRSQQARSLRQVLVQRLRKDAEVELNDEITRPTTTPAGV